MKALDESFLMVVFTLLLSRVHVFKNFIWTEKHGSKKTWHGKGFELRSISCLSCLIVRVRVVFRKTVVGDDWQFEYLSGSHLQGSEESLSHNRLTKILHFTFHLSTLSEENSLLDSEDDYRSGSWNISHQQQSFWRLLSPWTWLWRWLLLR